MYGQGDPCILGVAQAVRDVAAQSGVFAPKDVRELLIERDQLDSTDWWAMEIAPKRIDVELKRAQKRGHIKRVGWGQYLGA